MEVASVSSEYFDTKAYFKNKDRQLWQKGYVVGHNGLPIRRRKMKHNMSTKSMFFLSISSVMLFTFTVITILLWTGAITWGYDTICPEGFNMPNCGTTASVLMTTSFPRNNCKVPMAGTR